MIRVSDGKFTYEYSTLAELEAAVAKNELTLGEKSSVKFSVKIPAPWFPQLIETIKDIGGEVI